MVPSDGGMRVFANDTDLDSQKMNIDSRGDEKKESDGQQEPPTVNLKYKGDVDQQSPPK